MKITKFKLRRNKLVRTGAAARIVAGSVGTDAVQFSLDEAVWADLVATVVFKADAVEVSCVMADQAAAYEIPYQVMACAGVPLEVGVFGVDENGTVVVPTTYDKICDAVLEGANLAAIEADEPAQSVYAQWVSDVSGYATQASDAATLAQTSAQSATQSLAEVAVLVTQTPQISQNNTWLLWDATQQDYQDSALPVTECVITSYTQVGEALQATRVGMNGKFKCTQAGSYTSFCINDTTYAVVCGSQGSVTLTEGCWYFFLLDHEESTYAINFPSAAGGFSLTLVSGLSTPENEAENTVWLETSVAICGWSYDKTTPQSPQTGAVYFQEANAMNQFSVTLTDENASLLCSVGRTYQWQTDAWVPLFARVSDGSSWSSRCIVACDGASTMLGMGAYKAATSEVTVASSGSAYQFSVENGVLAGAFRSFDVTEITTIQIAMYQTTTSTVTLYAKAVDDSWSTQLVLSPGSYPSYYSIDVSSNSGDCYLYMSAQATSGTWNVYEIILF